MMKSQTRYEFLLQTIQAISSILDPSGILKRLTDNVRSFFGADELKFLVVASEEDEMNFWSGREVPRSQCSHASEGEGDRRKIQNLGGERLETRRNRWTSGMRRSRSSLPVG